MEAEGTVATMTSNHIICKIAADLKIYIILLQVCNTIFVLQMVEIQSDSSSYSIQNLGFGYLEDSNEIIEYMKEHHKKLLELRDMLQEQQTVMKAAVANVEKVKKGTVAPVFDRIFFFFVVPEHGTTEF
jgi:hypothetical protein